MTSNVCRKSPDRSTTAPPNSLSLPFKPAYFHIMLQVNVEELGLEID